MRNTTGKYRYNRSSFHIIIYIAGFSISSMLTPRFIYSTSIFYIEVPTFLSGWFYEFSRFRIKNIIYSTTKPVTALTHSF